MKRLKRFYSLTLIEPFQAFIFSSSAFKKKKDCFLILAIKHEKVWTFLFWWNPVNSYFLWRMKETGRETNCSMRTNQLGYKTLNPASGKKRKGGFNTEGPGFVFVFFVCFFLLKKSFWRILTRAWFVEEIKCATKTSDRRRMDSVQRDESRGRKFDGHDDDDRDPVP